MALNDAHTSDAKYSLIGFSRLLITFVFFGGWAAFAPLDSAALAPGVVSVKNYRKTVQHFEGGLVKAIYVQEGDRVNLGESEVCQS